MKGVCQRDFGQIERRKMKPMNGVGKTDQRRQVFEDCGRSESIQDPEQVRVCKLTG